MLMAHAVEASFHDAIDGVLGPRAVAVDAADRDDATSTALIDHLVDGALGTEEIALESVSDEEVPEVFGDFGEMGIGRRDGVVD